MVAGHKLIYLERPGADRFAVIRPVLQVRRVSGVAGKDSPKEGEIGRIEFLELDNRGIRIWTLYRINIRVSSRIEGAVVRGRDYLVRELNVLAGKWSAVRPLD